MTLPDWSFNNLEELIESRGDDVIHETGVTCPTCSAGDTYGSTILAEGKPLQGVGGSLSCNHCYGIGWIYRDPKVIRGLVTSVQSGQNKTLVESGWAVPGDSVFSPSLNVPPLGDFDKITMTYPVPVGSGQTIIRNAGNMGINQMLSTGLNPSQDRLWYYPSCVTYCVDQRGETYTQDVDFILDEKIIVWGTRRPKDGEVYTIKYMACLEWIVFSSPFTRFDNDRSLGQKVVLRKAHTAFVNAHPVDTPASRLEEAKEFSTRTTI